MGFRRTMAGKGFTRFLIMWIALDLIVLALISTKYSRYLLPLFMPLSVVCGIFISNALSEKWEWRLIKAMGGTALFACLLLSIVPIPIHGKDPTGVREIAPLLRYYSRRGYRIYLGKDIKSRLKAAVIFYTGTTPKPLSATPEERPIIIFSREELPDTETIYQVQTKKGKFWILKSGHK